MKPITSLLTPSDLEFRLRLIANGGCVLGDLQQTTEFAVKEIDGLRKEILRLKERISDLEEQLKQLTQH